MKFDVYKRGDGSVLVFKRGEISEVGDLPEGEPLYRSPVDGDWLDWCAERSNDRIRVCDLVGTYPVKFIEDLKEKAQDLFNRYRKEGREEGWGDLMIDYSDMTYTFRNSAAWKDCPTYYTFHQPLKWTNETDAPMTWPALRARDNLIQLYGMADAAHELGLDIVFDKDFQIHVFGIRSVWKTSFEW